MTFERSLAIIFVLAFALAVFFLFQENNASIGFLTEFTAGALGVFIALTVEREFENKKELYKSKELLNDFRSELQTCSALLIGEGNLCPTNIWNSSINTGLFQKIPNKTKRKLASLYFRISNHNYEAKRVRDVSIMAAVEKGRAHNVEVNEVLMKNSPSMFRNYAEMLHYSLSLRLISSEKKLKSDVDELLKENIWT